MPTHQNKKSKQLTPTNLRGWYILILAAALLFASILFDNVTLRIAIQFIGYITVALAVIVEVADVVKKKAVRLQIDLFMTALAAVLLVMAGYFIFSERAAEEAKVLRTTIQHTLPGIRETLPQNSTETGGTLSDVWVSKTENFVFVEYLSGKPLPDSADVDKTGLKPHVVKLVCNNAKYRSVLKSGWGFTFLYTSTANGKTYQVNVTSQDCK